MLTSNTIFLPNIILDESNYSNWLFRLESFLRGLSLYGYVDGSIPCPAESILATDGTTKTVNPEYVLWKSKDQNVINMIGQTLSVRAMSCAVGSNTAA
jgi:hypothetical protein